MYIPNHPKNNYTINGHSFPDLFPSSSIPPPGEWSDRTKEALIFLSHTPSLALDRLFVWERIRDWSLVAGRGGGLQIGRGGASELLPLRKGGGGAEKVLAILKGGTKS